MTVTTSEGVLKALRSVLPDGGALHTPTFEGNEWKYVKECLDTTFVSSVGKFVDDFERRLADFTGVRRAVAVANGTAALHICLKLAGVESGDEVLIPALSFVATANAVAYCGAIPHFVDVDRATLGLDPAKLAGYLREIAVPGEAGGPPRSRKSGRRIAACVPMHTFGHAVDMDPVAEICARYGIPLIEDAAESLGSYYKDRHTGSHGLLSALSFNGNKIITTGGGGAILTNDEALGAKAKHITTTAKLPHAWSFFHDEVGYNYRMPNLNAALGCAQMESLPDFLRRKRLLAGRYAEALAGVPGAKLFLERPFCRSNYWLNVIILDEPSERETLLGLTNSNGIMTRPVWTLLNKLPMYQAAPAMDLDASLDLESRILNIPSGSALNVVLKEVNT